jgi:membrane protease YdiL (CAAX protease family)
MISTDSLPPAEFILAILTLALGYLLYWFGPSFAPLKRLAEAMENATKEDLKRQELEIYLQKLLGFFLLGLLPAVVIWVFLPRGLVDYGIGLKMEMKTLYWFLGLSAASVIFIAVRPEKSLDDQSYPQVRASNWHPKRVARNSLVWALYLLGYEFAFRGLLFFSCLRLFGFWSALLINVLAYTYAHIPKNFQESIGAFVYGILLCIVAYETSSFWIPFWVHLILALGNDYTAVAKSTGMRFFAQEKDKG